jgi:inhibitor of cysteine peptidase
VKKALLVGAVVALAVGVVVGAVAWTSAGTGGNEGHGKLNLDFSDSGKTIETTSGDSLEITLESNPSTGFRWELANISDQAVLRQVAQEYRSPDAAPGNLVGAAGQEVWTFKAAGAGESTLVLEYSQPWEGGEKAAETFTVTVGVK